MLMSARRLRSDQAGFSLIELLVAMVIGSIVLTALMTLFVNGVTGAVQTSDRVDALQRGRVTMDRVVTLLNSQLCLLNPDGTGQPPILDGQNNSVTFYATLGAVDSNPTIYRLRYDSGTKRLYEDQFLPVPNGGAVTYPTYPATPNSSRVIGTNVLPVTASAPIFKYWQFITTAGPTLGMIDTTPLTTPLTSTTEFASVRMTITFVSQPEHTAGSTNDLRATTFVDGVATVGSANAGEPAKGVNC